MRGANQFASDEHTLATTTASPVAVIMLHTILAAVSVATILAMALATHWLFLLAAPILLSFIVSLIKRLQHRWTITNKRIIQTSGIFVRRTTTITHAQITDTSTITPLLSDLFGTGTTLVNTAGSEAHAIEIFGQHNPWQLNHIISDARQNTPNQHERF